MVLDWLPDAPECEEHGDTMEVAFTWHPQLQQRVPSYECERDGCDYAVIREDFELGDWR